MSRQVAAELIRTERLSKKVASPEGSLVILDDINFAVSRGEAVAIVGASGSGKTTLLSILAGLDLPSAGRVWIESTELSSLDEDARANLRGRLTAFVFQSFQLLSNLSAIENVMLPLEISGRDSPRETARLVLERVGLGERLEHYPRQLSGGEQQRVAIARAFAPRPAILFADEPTGNLDRRTAGLVADLMFSLRREYASTLLLVTHDEAMARRCDRVLTLEGGRLIAHGGAARA
jgi:putative ABC transport system ATP-binding protein